MGRSPTLDMPLPELSTFESAAASSLESTRTAHAAAGESRAAIIPQIEAASKEETMGRRQFIISTCDEKLLQLAQQKFEHLGDAAVFYRFLSFSEKGPEVERIHKNL